ncbi:MAG: proton-conducting transporter membrane subunit [Pirellulales bacterium]
MNAYHSLCLEIAVLIPICGALWIRRLGDTESAQRWSIAIAAGALAAVVLGWIGFVLDSSGNTNAQWSLLGAVAGRHYLSFDSLNVPLLLLVALIYLATIVTTPRTKARRFSFTWTLIAESIALATFSCRDAWLLIVLLTVAVYPPYRELRSRNQSTRVYAIHMIGFVGLLIAGQAMLEAEFAFIDGSSWKALPLLLAILVRSGVAPFHTWVPDLFQRAAFGTALTHVLPMAGVYAAVRLLLPSATAEAIQAIDILSLLTAVYAAGMALVQTDVRRFFSYQFLSQSSLVMVGIGIDDSLGVAGGLAVWLSVGLALAGFGLTLRSVEARCGRLPLDKYHGLYEQLPTLAVFFLLTGLASIGFPGTFGFIGVEMLIGAAVLDSPWIGLAIVCAAAINGVSLMRAYLSLFTGTRHTGTVALRMLPAERIAVLALAALIIGGGLFPQPAIESRYDAAEELRASRIGNVSQTAP